MEYYAAALREQGAVKINTDGIMIKGCLLNGEKIVVMAFCHTESVKDCKHQRSGLFENLSSQKEAERSDLIIRFLEAGTEELMAGYETACDFDGKRKCIELFQSFMELFEGVAAKKRLIRGKTITLIIICGQKMQVLSNTKKDIYVIKSEGLSKQREYERIDLSREMFEKSCGYKKTSYNDAIRTLKEKGYLVQTAEHQYEFHTKPQRINGRIPAYMFGEDEFF